MVVMGRWVAHALIHGIIIALVSIESMKSGFEENSKGENNTKQIGAKD